MALTKPLKLGDYSDSRHGGTVYEIFSMDDFPTPAGGVITLPSGRYVIKCSLTTSDRFASEASGVVTFAMDNQRFNVFEYTGTDTLFTGANSAYFVFEQNNFLLSGNNAQFIDVTNGNFIIRSAQILFSGTGGYLGTTVNAGVLISDLFASGFADGFVIDGTPYGLMTETIMQGTSGGTGTYISITGDTSFFTVEGACTMITDTNESVFYIEPTNIGPISITSTINLGSGSYFEAGVTGPIASFTDVATGTTAVDVTNDSGDALFTTLANHGLVVGELPVHTTFPESSYNTNNLVVTEIPTAKTYKIGIDYVSDESGLFATTTCQVNDVGHGRSNEDKLSIFGTINFNGGYTVFNAQTDTFEITLGKAFPGSETTGNWDTGSQEGANAKRSKYVNTHRNGAQPDSASIGSMVVGGNVEPTTITLTETFYDLDFDGNALEASNNELWTLTDTTTGEMRYDGLLPFSATYHGLIAAYSAGGAQRFNFQLLKNGSPLSAPDNIDIPLEIDAEIKSSPLLWSIEVEPDDSFRIQVENDDGTSDITIDTLKVEIR